MAVTLVNLTGDISDLIGDDFNATRTRVWIDTNIDGDVVIDTTGNQIHLGNAQATVNSDGTFTFTDLIATNSTTNPTAFQYQVHIEYLKRLPQQTANGKHSRWSSGWFSLTATADLADVAAESYVPPTWQSSFIASAEAAVQVIADEAQDSADDAASSATASAASATAAETSATEAETFRNQASEIALGDAETAFDGFLGARDLPANGTELSASTADKVSTDLADDESDIGAAAAALIGLRTHLIDTDYANLEAALTALPNYGTLEIRGTHSRTSAFAVAKPCTIRFSRGGSITVTAANTDGISVTTSYVTIVDPNLTGDGSGTAGTSAAIRAVGTVGSPVTNFAVLRRESGTIQAWSRYGVELEYVNDFTISGLVVTNVAYCGIQGISVLRGRIDGNKVTTIVQPSGYTNSYGIGVTRDSTLSLANSPRSADILITNNYVEGVPNWEGIDTHAGERITIAQNVVKGCKNAIVATPGKNTGGTDTYAPLQVNIVDNQIDSGVTDGSYGPGIGFSGVVAERATGLIARNTIVGHGTDAASGGSNTGAIYLAYTQGAVCADNRIIQPAVAGIQVYTYNTGLSVRGNVVEDFWSNLFGASAAIYIRSNDNTVTVAGTRITRGAKSATKVNDRGFYGTGSTNVTVLDGGGNDFFAATNPVVDANSTFKMSAFGAVAGAVRPTALTQTYSAADRTLGAYTADVESVAYTGSPADAASTAKLTDLNALRVAYENLRAHHEDLAQFVNALVDDLQALGIER